jgi:FkbM family methyltransferase
MPEDGGLDWQERFNRLEGRLQDLTHMVAEVRSLIGPWAVNLADGHLLVHTMHKLLLIVDSLDLIITPQLVVYRQWEPEITDLFWNSIRSDTVFVDVGANIGYFTCLAGARIHAGGEGTVIAVEPNPRCYELIERNLLINWSMCPISLHKAALGAESGEVWLTSPLNRAANAHVSKEHGNVDVSSSFRVPMTTLDAIVPEDRQVDILKVDVEGYEASVFMGARRVIARSPNIKIIMEWSRDQMHDAGVSPGAMYDLIATLGLAPRKLPTSRSLLDVTDENSPLLSLDELDRLSYSNILLTKRH